MQSHLESERLIRAAQSAVACEEATRVPAELTVAQWAVESGWGIHEPGNNCFGIKAYSGCYGVQRLNTAEFINGVEKTVQQEFATFPTLTDCFQKHAMLICEGRPYRAAWQEYETSKNITALVRGIAPIYATAPDYARTLLEVLAMPRVLEALAEIRRERLK
jgi:flagellum-specific peptidoglycan hydrolase FlgJ